MPSGSRPADRQSLLARLACRISVLTGNRVVVAIDGVDGSGKTVFADGLAASLRERGMSVVTAGIDGFHNPRAIRYRHGKESPEGFFLDSYDYAAFRQVLLEPFRAGAATVETARFDHRADKSVSDAWAAVEARAVLLVEGIFLHRDDLSGAWDLSIFLDAPFAVTYGRMAIRDGSDPDPHAPRNRRYMEGQRVYLSACRPQLHASILIDNSDFATPRIVRGRQPGW